MNFWQGYKHLATTLLKDEEGMVGFLIQSLLQIYQGIFQWKNFVNRLRFDRIMATRLWPHLFGPPYTASSVQLSSAAVNLAFYRLSLVF